MWTTSRPGRTAVGSAFAGTRPLTIAMDLAHLWDFGDPEGSELRLRSALETASGDEALILRTQIARTHGLRRDFARAREMLGAIEAEIRAAGPEARAHHALELGRTYASAAHPPEAQTPEAKALARAAFGDALTAARAAARDDLAADALHMLAFVDSAPAEQLRCAREALALVEGSIQPGAKKWEASLRNNAGYALHRLGRLEEALAEFRRAAELRERGTDAGATRIAHWMVAWTLRALDRTDEALELQLRLERECDAAGAPDPHVFEELELLCRARGDEARAGHYARRRQAAAGTAASDGS